ncbi:hypothetical protein QAD02_000758 [Eretmocerus hayati]|uniref:Uncharacterized protein n=1 Tax=Eretmocerus hayati TaxID=131215 RepID=A0ACC2NGN1_9HYME|nr:hypothetical protein QAD02_000758 [Eretmocerus hayati]
MSAEDAIKCDENVRKWFEPNSTTQLNKNHKHYYQIIGQLEITKRAWCLLVIGTAFDYVTIKVPRDDVFWEQKMRDKLIRLYNDCMLPEIVDSREKRKMDIRDPVYVIAAKKLVQQTRLSLGIATSIQDPQQPSPRQNAIPGGDGGLQAPERVAGDIPTYFNTRSIFVDIEAGVQPTTLKLEDASMDHFMSVLKLHVSDVEVQSSHFFLIPETVQRVRGPAIAFLGCGTGHWKTAYFDGDRAVSIYDSLPSRGVVQPDLDICGVYAISFAMDKAQKRNPAEMPYSLDVVILREICGRIMTTMQLEPAPLLHDVQASATETEKESTSDDLGEFYENRYILLNPRREITPASVAMNCDTMDYFLLMLSATSKKFSIHSTQFVFGDAKITRVTGKAIQIIGVDDYNWKTLYFDGQTIEVYDIIGEGRKITPIEFQYMEHRFLPQLKRKGIIYKKLFPRRVSGADSGALCCGMHSDTRNWDKPCDRLLLDRRGTHKGNTLNHCGSIIDDSIPESIAYQWVDIGT